MIHTKVVALWIEITNQANVAAITTALILWLVCKERASAHAKAYFAAKTLTANQKVMQLGVDAALDLLKMKAANVFHVRFYRFL